jgi:serine/threonine protein kinase
MNRSLIQPGYEPIPGYILRKQVGAGGYGEVWLSDAPGGLRKAIKFVFGNVDDNRATTELKSLNRIRKLNHPFILSLERVEIVEGQLVIVTELAQGSLHDKYNEYRQKGFIGIARDRLLRYLGDAADGLDFLCQEHDLQHLDVKPGNLLLIADRVKVADFGLIKELESNSQSMMSGMTPTYAAPELFDGRPGRYSDQYSLAIVYQELLTGTLPFRGRTAAQLANEHLHKAPNLEAVPLLERPILSKALSKKPHMRYGDCREFIRALTETRQEVKLVSPVAEKQSAASPASPANRGAARRFSGRSLRQSTNEQIAEEMPKFEREIRPIELQTAMPPIGPDQMHRSKRILYLGVGGTGGVAVQQIVGRCEYRDSDETRRDDKRTQCLYLDTDNSAIERILDASQSIPLPHSAVLPVRLNSSQYYRQSTSPDLLRISRRWIYNIPRSQKTEGVRPLGLLAFLDQARTCFDRLVDTIDELVGEESGRRSLTVYLFASAHGGTGSAMVSELGFMLRQISAAMEIDLHIELLLLCADTSQHHNGDLAAASAYSCLKEISEHFESGGLHTPLASLPASIAVDQPPFDYVTLVPGGVLGEQGDWQYGIDQAVAYAWGQDHTDLGHRLAWMRLRDKKRLDQANDTQGLPWLGTIGLSSLDLASFSDSEGSTNRCSLLAIQAWTSLLNRTIADLGELQNSHPSTEKKHEQTDLFWVSNLFSACGWGTDAWVKQLMATISSQGAKAEKENPNTPISGDKKTVQNFFGSRILEQEQSDLDAIAEKLAIDNNVGTQAVCDLLESSRKRFFQWIDRNLLGDTHGWMHFGIIIKTVHERLLENANQLLGIAADHCSKHDQVLETAYEGKDIISHEVELKLEALALEARIYSLASQMLNRLAGHVKYLGILWANHAKQLSKDLMSLSQPIMDKMQIADKDFNSKTPDFAKLGKDAFTHAASSYLLDHTHIRLLHAWSIKEESKRYKRSERVELKELFPFVKAIIEATQRQSQYVESYKEEATESLATIVPSNGSTSAEANPAEGNVGVAVFPSRKVEASPSIFRVRRILEVENEDIGEEFDRVRSKLLDYGGSLRNVLMISDELSQLLQDRHFKQAHERSATVISDPVSAHCTVLSVGERLDLDTVLERVYHPTPSLQELANRISCRVE